MRSRMRGATELCLEFHCVRSITLQLYILFPIHGVRCHKAKDKKERHIDMLRTIDNTSNSSVLIISFKLHVSHWCACVQSSEKEHFGEQGGRSRQVH